MDSPQRHRGHGGERGFWGLSGDTDKPKNLVTIVPLSLCCSAEVFLRIVVSRFSKNNVPFVAPVSLW